MVFFGKLCSIKIQLSMFVKGKAWHRYHHLIKMVLVLAMILLRNCLLGFKPQSNTQSNVALFKKRTM
jgi:hypothetical protein